MKATTPSPLLATSITSSDALSSVVAQLFPETVGQVLDLPRLTPLLRYVLAVDSPLLTDLPPAAPCFNDAQLAAHLANVCAAFKANGIGDGFRRYNSYRYALPYVLSEYPRFSRPLNQAIDACNSAVFNDDDGALNRAFLHLIDVLQRHALQCQLASINCLLAMLYAWSPIDLPELTDDPAPEVVTSAPLRALSELQLEITRVANPALVQPIFTEQTSYRIDDSGGLQPHTQQIILNAFGLKPGGHTDGRQHSVPMPVRFGLLYCHMLRELGQRIELPVAVEAQQSLKLAILRVLLALGMQIDESAEAFDDYHVLPFSREPAVAITPARIRALLSENGVEDTTAIADYLASFMLRLQLQPALALGIGANDDGTVSLSHDGSSFPFQFNDAAWGTEFARLSLHRQGPSQAKMNAMKGVAPELATIFGQDFSSCVSLQRKEWRQTLYSAIVDQLMANVFPHPDQFENSAFPRFQKRMSILPTATGELAWCESLYPDATGIFKADGELVPKHRRAGTIDVQALAKAHDISLLRTQASYAGDPLAAQHQQYQQALQGGERGDLVYDYKRGHVFVPNPTTGQVLKFNDGSLVPLIGVVPKNFDKAFKRQETELCASFVVRMLHSSGLKTNCPSFAATIHALLASFLPTQAAIPDLPEVLRRDRHIVAKHRALLDVLAQASPDYDKSAHCFLKLMKNIVYSLRCEVKDDDNFLEIHYGLLSDLNRLRDVSRSSLTLMLHSLRINMPLDSSGQPLARMHVKLHYLEQLLQAFFPAPTEASAVRIHKLADTMSARLMKEGAIQDYFRALSQHDSANLSRSVSPGMMLAVMRHGAHPDLAKRLADITHLHRHCLDAGGRSPEGGREQRLSSSERRLDRVIKGGGKLAAVLQDDRNPVKYVSAPIARARQGADRSAAWVRDRRGNTGLSVAAMVGGGSLGLIAGVLETSVKVPVKTLHLGFWLAPHELLSRAGCLPKTTRPALLRDHALYLPAAPNNSPGDRVAYCQALRDILLAQWVLHQQTPDETEDAAYEHLQSALQAYLFDFVQQAYPAKTTDEIKQLAAFLTRDDVVKRSGLFSHDFLARVPDSVRTVLVGQVHVLSENVFIVVFKAMHHVATPTSWRACIEANKHMLLPLQQTLLKALYPAVAQLIPVEHRQLMALCAPQGALPSAMRLRDLSAQQLFDQLQLIFRPQLQAQSPGQFMLSEFERARRKLTNFMQAEVTAKLLELADVKQILGFAAEFLDVDAFSVTIDCLYAKAGAEQITAFYHTGCTFVATLQTLPLQKSLPPNLITLINDVINVTMRRLVQQTLSHINDIADMANANPLAQCDGFDEWLANLQADSLRRLLAAQLQAPYLHQAIYRQAMILDRIEQKKDVTTCEQRIRRTGLQRQLRLHYYQQGSASAAKYIKSSGLFCYRSGGQLSLLKALLDAQPDRHHTLRYAIDRVSVKCG